MTPRWCERRSELILKTLKGFVMENTAWGRAESKTIQLIVPVVRCIEGLVTFGFK